jgi:hypothetical protein
MSIPGLRLRIFGFVLAASFTPVRAEVRRALLVGIDEYTQPADQPSYQLSAGNRERLKAIQGTRSRQHHPAGPAARGVHAGGGA